MATYKFPQFNVEISDPVVSIDLNTIGDKALDKLLSVDIFLIVPGARFGVRMENMPYLNTWDDDDVFSMVDTALEAFEV
jgi:hypothetical protein